MQLTALLGRDAGMKKMSRNSIKFHIKHYFMWRKLRHILRDIETYRDILMYLHIFITFLLLFNSISEERKPRCCYMASVGFY